MTDPKQTTEYLLGTMDEKLDKLLKSAESHGGRITALEQWRTKSTGYAAGAVGVVTVVVGVLKFLHV